MLLLERPRPVPSTAGFTSGIEGRINLLDPMDQQLLRLSLANRLNRREAARLIGRDPGNVTRRLRRLLNRLHDPIVVALCERGQALPENYRQVGLDFFLRHRPHRMIAAGCGLTESTVRQILAYIRGWQRGLKG